MNIASIRSAVWEYLSKILKASAGLPVFTRDDGRQLQEELEHEQKREQ